MRMETSICDSPIPTVHSNDGRLIPQKPRSQVSDCFKISDMKGTLVKHTDRLSSLHLIISDQFEIKECPKMNDSFQFLIYIFSNSTI